MLDRGSRIRSGAVTLSLVCLLTAACGRAAPSRAVNTSGMKTSATSSGSQAPPISESSTDEYDYDDPCSLLEPSEVEAVLGSKLAVAPFRSGGDPDSPTADGDHCIYETADFHVISMSVDFTGGAEAFGMANFGKKLLGSAPDAQLKQAFKLQDGTELTGEWDEATLMPMNCCDFLALRGDQMIDIDFTATDLTLPQAAGLVDAAFKRIDRPLKIDGGAHVEEAAALAGTRPRPVDPCSVLTRAEVEAILGPLLSDPKPNGTDECDYQVPSQGPPAIYSLFYWWRGGYAEYRSKAHVAGIASDALTQRVKWKQNDTVYQQTIRVDMAQAVSDTGAWEWAGVIGFNFEAVKRDVLIEAGIPMGTDQHKAARLASAALRKL